MAEGELHTRFEIQHTHVLSYRISRSANVGHEVNSCLIISFYKMSKKTSLLEVATKSLTFWYLCLSVVLVFVLSDRYIYELQIWILYIFIFMSSKIVVGTW